MPGYCPCYLTSRSPNKIKATKGEKLHAVKRYYDYNTTHEITGKYFVLFRYDAIILFKKKKKRKTTKNICTKNKTRRKSKQTAAPSRQTNMF